MQMISYFPASGSAGTSTRAVAPVVNQEKLTIAVGAGSAYQDLALIASGQCAADAGQVSNSGCYEVELLITYLTGADCDACTVDSVSTKDVTVTVPANSAFPLPPGLVSRVQVRTLDSAGAPVANTTEQKLSWYSAYAPGCGGCTLVP